MNYRNVARASAFAAIAAVALPVSAFAQSTATTTAPVAGQPGTVVAPGTVAPAQSALPAGTTLPAVPGMKHGAQVVAGVDGVATAGTPDTLGKDGLPSIDNASAGNVAGLISYCVHKHVLHDTTSRSVGRSLAKRPDVKNDQYYSLGGKGLLQTATTTPFDIKSLGLSQRTKLCSDLVTKGKTLD